MRNQTSSLDRNGNIPSPVALFAQRSDVSGVAIAASGTRAALEAAGIEVVFCDLAHPESWSRASTAGVALVHANPDRLSRTLRDPHVLRAAIGNRPAIGYWVWEAPGVPPFWRPWLPLVDELWVPSRFVAQGLAGELGTPISVVPHPVAPPEPRLSRRQLGFAPDRFMFLFVFNARSNLARKNPACLIQAYCKAFPREDGAPMLVLKTIGMRPAEAEALEALAGGRRDVLILNRHMSADETASLIATCDCYVSLHRAEGFGLTVAEAMFFARPVICTGYSGVLDFATADTAYLVSFSLGRLQKGHGIFPPGTVLAQPEIDQAASLMRHVFDERGEAAAKGKRAAASVRSKLSLAVVGDRMRKLLGARLAAGQRLSTA